MNPEGAETAPSILLPVDLVFRDLPATEDRWGWRDGLAVAAAALLHALVVLALIWDWRFPVAPPQPEAVPVRIVFAPPKPEPAPTPSPPPPLIGGESGKDQKTVAPPPADVTGPEATKPPEPQPPPQEKPAPSRDAAKAQPRKEAARREPRKTADKAQAPRPMPQVLTLERGEREETGDPYLNLARDLLERHRVYPKVMGQFGLPVEGTPVYAVLIDRAGAVRGIKLVHPSGAPALDQAGIAMIRATAPFPALPGNYPGEFLEMTVTIHLFPPAS